MKVLEVDKETYKIFKDTLTVSDRLKPAVYSIGFNQMTGYSLNIHSPLTVTEKLYGSHEKKVDKIIRSFDAFNRSMGVIFSGDKGIGKSIAARMLCEKMVAKGYPVIMVENNYPGIVDFIDSIQQECVVLFDEFEKKFRASKDDDDETSDQDNFLSLFDGTSQTKRLYLVTCNEIYDLSDFVVNRPGRFHYHICWEYPTADEIRMYLEDKLEPKYYGQIDAVVNFSIRVQLNYDCLRAIAFELNLGEKFVDVIDDLNIKNTERSHFTIYVEFKNSEIIKSMDSFDICQKQVERYINSDTQVEFSPAKLKRIGEKLFANDYKIIRENCSGDEKDVTSQVKNVWLEREGKDTCAYDITRMIY